MRALSSDWLDDLEKSEDVFWSQETNLLRPVMPWLTPPVYPVLKRFIERNGVRKHFSAGELLIDPTEPVTSISVVERGITLRGAGAGGVDSPAAAYSTPGRLACGNLNFFLNKLAQELTAQLRMQQWCFVARKSCVRLVVRIRHFFQSSPSSSSCVRYPIVWGSSLTSFYR